MRAIILSAALAMLAAPALAAPCHSAGVATAKTIEALPADAGADFNKALADATSVKRVADAAKAAGAACTRPEAGLLGENTDGFARILKVKGSPDAAIAFLQPIRFKQGGKDVTWYAVVKSFGSGAVLISGLLDNIPDDKRVADLLARPYDGGFEPLEFNAASGKLVDKNVYLPGQLARAGK